MFKCIYCYTNVPIAFCRTITSLNKRLKLYVKTDSTQNILKLSLLVIPFINGISESELNISFITYGLPEMVVVEIALVCLATGVIHILDIN